LTEAAGTASGCGAEGLLARGRVEPEKAPRRPTPADRMSPRTATTDLRARLPPVGLPLVDQVQPHHTADGAERRLLAAEASDEGRPHTDFAAGKAQRDREQQGHDRLEQHERARTTRPDRSA